MKTLEFLQQHREWVFFIALIIVARLILSAYLPLTEFSEARYAEIARKILAFNDWTTLWYSDTVPFWGKPPLAFWSVAVSYLALGVNETAARFSPLMYTLLTALVLTLWTRRSFGHEASLVVGIVYLGTWLVLQTAGAVLTDALLTLATTVVMISFWEACVNKKRHYAYLMWIALAVGLLAKGPIALVMCGLACGAWVLVFNRWLDLFKYGCLVTGFILMCVIALPWYYAAEIKTPGFFEYFIIGEHFERYTQSEWPGDPYGAVKERPYGTIWAFFVVGALPWIVPVLYNLRRADVRTTLVESFREDPQFVGYLALWVTMPLIFFTLASNVIATYVLPVIPAFTMLLARHFRLLVFDTAHPHRVAAASAAVFCLISFAVFKLYIEDHRYNQKPMIDRYHELNAENPGDLIYTGISLFSPQFYTEGRVIYENNRTRYPKHDETFYLATREMWLPTYQYLFQGRCETVMKRTDFSLFYCPARGGPADK